MKKKQKKKKPDQVFELDKYGNLIDTSKPEYQFLKKKEQFVSRIGISFITKKKLD